MSEVKVNKISPRSGTTVTLGDSGDTFAITSGASISGFTSTGIDDNATSTAITINSSEQVGIGTTSPSNVLHIKNSNPTIRLEDSDASSSIYGQIISNGAGDINLSADVGNAGSSTKMTFSTDGSERMRITSSGNVGIGYSATLNGRLNVNGNVGLGNFISASNPTGGTYNLTDPDGSNINQIVRIGEDDDSGNAVADLQLVSYGSNDNFGGGNLRFVNSRYSNDVALIKGSRESATTGYLAFYTESSGLKERMHIHDNGDISFYEDTGTTAKFYWDASTERLGIGTSSPSNLLDVKASSNNEDVIRISHPSSPTAAGALLGFNSDGTTDNNVVTLGIHYSSDFYDVLNIQRSTRNVGIGTVNPQQQLDISSNVPRIRFSDLSVTNLRHVIGSEANDLEIRCDDGNVQASSHIGFKIDGNEKVRITDAGDVGIGTTSPDSILDLTSTPNNNFIHFNATTGGSNGDIIGGFEVNNTGGTIGKLTVHRESTSSSGYMAFQTGTSEKMRIQNNGNVGIGTISPAHNLEIVATNSGSINDTLQIRNNTTTTGSGSRIRFITSTDLNSDTNGASIASVRNGNDNDLVFEVENSEAMRIDSSGNVGIGTTSTSSDAVNIKVADTRVTSGRCLDVHHSKTDTTFSGIVARFQSARNTTNGTYEFIRCAISGQSNKFIVTDGGTIQAVNTTVASISDERIKQDIVDAKSQWDDIKALKFKNFKKKQAVRDDGDNALKELGVIAQDVESAGMNGLIEMANPDISNIKSDSSFGTLWTEDDEEVINGTETVGEVKEIKEKVKTVKYSMIWMKSVKALQEAMERIEKLEAEVTALKNQP